VTGAGAAATACAGSVLLLQAPIPNALAVIAALAMIAAETLW